MYKPFVEFKLEHAIAGGKVDTLILYAPNNSHTPLTAVLYNMLNSGMMKFAQANKSNEVETEEVSEQSEAKIGNIFEGKTGQEITQLLKMIPSDDYKFYASFCDTFRALMLSDNICKVKSEDKKIPSGYFDSISMFDGERMMGVYLENFFTI